MKRSVVRALALLALFLFACDDGGPSGPPIPERVEVAVVVNSQDRTITVFPTDDPAPTTTIGLGPDGSPVTVAAQGSMVAVPLGVVPAVAIVDLDAQAVVRTVALSEGSGATGVAFVNDSIAPTLVRSARMSRASAALPAASPRASASSSSSWARSFTVRGSRRSTWPGT
ncbi:MAG: hypothetical protein L0221_08520 [Chloroflexi bacterium]|nr:hypothetical protein [Chloroflexota bacterium]